MRKVKLSEIAELNGGSTPKTKIEGYWNGDIVWLSPTDLPEIGEITRISDSERKITEEGLNSCSAKLLDPGTVIFSSRASIGKIAINEIPVATNQGFINFTCSDEIDNMYLAYVLKYYTEDIVQLSNSTTFKEVSKRAIKDFKIPLPSLSEQKAIVAKLDRAQRLIDIDKEMLAKYDKLIQSVFLEMFGDPVTNPKGWDKVKLKELTKINSGSTPSRKKPEYFGGKIPWVKTTEVNGRYIYESEETITELGLKESSCKLYPKDTILVAMYGQGKTRGNVGMLKLEATTNQACAAIYPSEKFKPDFLFNYLKLQYDELREMGRGGNQPNLNVGMIKDYEIILPPIEMQNKFIAISNSIMEERTENNRLSKKSEELFSSLVQEAFG